MARRRHDWSWCTSYWCYKTIWYAPKYYRRLVETVPTVWDHQRPALVRTSTRNASPGVDDTYTSRNSTGHVFFSRMNPGFISTAAMVCTVVLVNVSMTVVWFSGVLSAEIVSWCGVESHPVAEQLLWLWTAHLQASDTVTKSYGPMFSHLCNNITPRCKGITLAHMSGWPSPTSWSRTMLIIALACNVTGFVSYRAILGCDAASLTWPPNSAVDVTWPVTCACGNLEWYFLGIFQNTCCINEASLPSMHRFQWWTYQEVAGSTPAEVGNILSWRLIMKYFLRPFSPFRWFKKGSCQFLAKECAKYWLTA